MFWIFDVEVDWTMLLYDGMITMITSLTVYGVLKFLLFKCVYATMLHLILTHAS